jgi:hypothetical protein
MNQPDKFFREKLEGYQKPVQPSAWSKVEANLDKKNNKLFWLKIAAGLILLLSASVFLVLKNQPQKDMLSQKTKTDLPSHNDVADSSNYIKEDRTTNTTAKQKNIAQAKANTTNRKNIKRRKEFIPPAQDNVLTNVSSGVKNNDNTQINDNIEVEPIEIKDVQTVAAQQAVSKKESKSITLIYAAEEVNEKYLDKKSLAEATHEDKKPSTFKKLLEKAYDLKTNQDPIGELRQKKNEILALNFKNEKQRSQNR